MKGKLLTLLLLLITSFSVTGCVLMDNSTPFQESKKSTNPPLESWGWKEIAPGLTYSDVHINLSTNPELPENKDLILVKIDPKLYTFEVYQNYEQESAKTIQEIHEQTNSLLSFNGGFFTEEFTPTGLLISNGHELRQISYADLLDGVLTIDKNGNTNFFSHQDLQSNPQITPQKYHFAIQNGPVLINQYSQIEITRDTGKKASRTAIGIDKDGNIVLIILKQSLLNTDNTISLYKFAHLLQEISPIKDLGLHSVLNLDGGPSTGLIIDDKYYPEMEKVQNVVLVKLRPVGV